MNVKKIYYGFVSLVSVIAIAISSGVLLSSLGKMYLISDEEYIQANHWIIDSCKYKNQIKPLGDNNTKISSDYKSYDECVKEKTQQAILQRKYNFKLSIISSLSTLIVFLILFAFHYPKFKKLDN